MKGDKLRVAMPWWYLYEPMGVSGLCRQNIRYRLSTSVYQKTTHTGIYMPFHSNDHRRTTTGMYLLYSEVYAVATWN